MLLTLTLSMHSASGYNISCYGVRCLGFPLHCQLACQAGKSVARTGMVRQVLTVCRTASPLSTTPPGLRGESHL